MAQRAGVSPATVSRVLNGSATVGEAKRQLVLAAIEELGYRPNRLASNLRRRQAEMIGVVVSDIENPHFTQMVRAVEDAAYLRGYRVLLCNTDEDPAKQRDYLRVLTAERVAGVILSPTDSDAFEIADLLDHGVSVVAFDRSVPDRRADVVVVHNVAGARRGAEHLLECGHVHVGFVGGLAGVQTADERLDGYREAVTAAGLEAMVADGGFRAEGARHAAAALVDAGATALLVANNLMTIGALQAIRERGLRIPDDVAIVSFDDPPWAELTDPPLTTLAQPVRQMAGAAVELLLDRISDGRTRRRRRVFELELRHRGSCCRRDR
ncbi:MAG TPA: LacI family DNA-binding transcriptional regulator [Solirubrobacteraceae bacterium]|nr:LacI family DNA-binding transcriptional regulator [Solirubrobacteraceae bacterium]